MSQLHQTLLSYPELNDQIELFEQLLHQENHLAPEHRKVICWAAALASKDSTLLDFIRDKAGLLSKEDRRAVIIASSRMALTNPYFMGRSVHPLQTGGSLQSLNLRPFHTLGISDETGYHYACIAISLINNGFACYNSHISSLKSTSQSEDAIDQAIRLTAVVKALGQILFNSTLEV